MGMAIDKETVKYVAHLARIELDPKELDRLSVQLRDILDFIDKLNKLDVSDAKPTSHILPINNVLREDVPRQSLPIEKILGSAPHRQGNFFGVPKVIE
jgi:aspartyl-tRNA(Asn)/glutamyl-tRNA(Gln) amidotransferase subunit C